MTSIFRAKPVNLPGAASEGGVAVGLTDFANSLRETAAQAPLGTPGAPAVPEKVTQLNSQQASRMLIAVSGVAHRLKSWGADLPIDLPSPKALREAQRSEDSAEGIASYLMTGPAPQALGALMDTGNYSPEQQLKVQQENVAQAERDLAAVSEEATQLGRDWAALPPEERMALMRSPDLTPEQLSVMSADDLMKMALSQYEPEMKAAREKLAHVQKYKPRQQMWKHIVETSIRSFAQTGVGALNSVADAYELTLGAALNGGVVQQSDAGRAFDDFDAALVKLFPGDEAKQLDFATTLAAGGGSFVGFWLTGLFGRTVGLGADATSAIAGALVGSNAAYEDAEKYTADGMKRLLAYLGGGVIGVSEAAPIDRMFFRANALTDGLVVRMVKTSVAGSQEEFIQELFQSMSQDLIAKVIYDPARSLDPAEWFKQAAAGAIIGGTAGAGTAMLPQTDLPEGVNLTPELVEQIADEQFNLRQAQLDAQLGVDAVDGEAAPTSTPAPAPAPAEAPSPSRAGASAATAGEQTAVPQAKAARSRLVAAQVSDPVLDIVARAEQPQTVQLDRQTEPDGVITYKDGGTASISLRAVKRADGSFASERTITADDGTVTVEHLADGFQWRKGPAPVTVVTGFTSQTADAFSDATAAVAMARDMSPGSIAWAADGTQSVVLNPAAPVEQQVAVQVAPAVETPQFKAWFKDSAARAPVVSSRDPVAWADKPPLKVYHGTQDDFTAFNARGKGTTTFIGIPVTVFRSGIFFAEDKNFAQSFADQGGKKGRVIEAYLSIQNPLDLSNGAASEEDAQKLIDAGLDEKWVREWLGDPKTTWEAFESADSPEEADFFVNAVKAAGFDGVRMTELDPDEKDGDATRDVWVAFEPTQIKSATNNSGAFDPNDPNIDRAVADPAITSIPLASYETQPLPDHEAKDRGPIPIVVQAAKAYAAAAGIQHTRARSYAKADTSRAARIAQAYADMKHQPDDPAVQAAYRAMAEETIAQFQFVKATGLVIEPIPSGAPITDEQLDAELPYLKQEEILAADPEYAPMLAEWQRLTDELDANTQDVSELTALEEAGEAGEPGNRSEAYVAASRRAGDRNRALYAKRDPLDAAIRAKQAAATAASRARSLERADRKLAAPTATDPYASPREVLADIRRGHMYYYRTDDGFGTDANFDPSQNPLLEKTNERDAAGNVMLVHDVFRVVHDFFGHGLEGAGFGPRGEENAWQSHMRLYSASAVPAMTSETRGQNSWVNYGPFGEQNRANPKETTYADQKTGIMPSWTWSEGVIDSTVDAFDAPTEIERMLAPANENSLQYESGTVGPSRFRAAIAAAKLASPFGASVNIYSLDDYANMRLFLAPDGLSGFALKGEDIVSVFSHPDAKGQGRLRKIIDTAVANGGRTLDAFDGRLVQMYAELGFKEVRREPWDESQKPEGWKDEWGTPDVVFMEFTGDSDEGVASYGTTSKAFEEWDNDAAIREPERGKPMPGADGEPLLLYCGAPHGFRFPDREMWLTPDRGTATDFGSARSGASGRDAEFDAEGNNISGGNVFTFYARMENPYEYDWEDNSWDQGPETEYPTIYVANGKNYESYGDAQQGIEDARDAAAEQAADDTRSDLEDRLSVVEGDGFEVQLASTAPMQAALQRNRVNNTDESLRYQRQQLAERQAVLAANPADESAKYHIDYLSKSGIPSYEKTLEKERNELIRLEALEREAQPEVLGTFETEDEAQDFIDTYTAEAVEAAEEAARDAISDDIREETDYDAESAGQTTDSVVRYARDAGYDGVIFRNVDEGNGPVDVYVVIKPGNAKSTANLGTWNREDPDILRMTGTSNTRAPYFMEPTRPAQGVPEPAGATTAAVPEDQRLTTMARTLAKIIDTPVRQGRLRAKGAGAERVMGEFNRNTGVVRLRTSTDYSTLVHELGHSLQTRIREVDAWAQSNKAALMRFAKRSYAGDLSNAPAETRLREGVAEFFRVYMTEPAYHARKQPKLMADFEAAIKAHDPAMATQLKAVQEQFQYARSHTSTQAVRAMVRSGYRELGLAAAIKEIKDNGFPTWWEETYRRHLTQGVDNIRPLRDIVSKVLNAGQANRGVAIDLKYADNPSTWAQLGHNAHALAMMETKHGVVPYRGTRPASASLRDALMVSQGANPQDTNLPGVIDQERYEAFNDYLITLRVIDEYRRLKEGLLDREPSRLQLPDFVQAKKDYETRYPEFVQAASMANDFARALWQKRFDAGMLSKDDYDAGNERQFYTPLQRDMTDRIGKGVDGLSFGGSAISRGPRFRGSDRDILRPMEVMETMAFALEREIAENEPIRLLAQLGERAGMAGAYVERIPASQLAATKVSMAEVVRELARDDTLSPEDATDLRTMLAGTLEKGNFLSFFRAKQASAAGENILFFWEGGQIAAIKLNDGELGADVVNLLSGASREVAPYALELLSGTSNFFRGAITAHPAYTVANFVRGELTAWFTTEGYKPFVSGLRGIWDELAQTEVAKSYNRGMGLMGGLGVASSRKAVTARDIRAIVPTDYIGQAFSERTFVGASQGFARVTEVTETGGRLGVYRETRKRALADGLTEFEAQHEAAYIATDMMDYGLHGSRMLAVRRTIPFLNAQIQSLYRFTRTLGGSDVAQRKGLAFALGAYFKDINGLDLSRTEKAQLRVGRKAWLKMAAMGLLSALLNYLLQDDPDYQDANDYERATHWILPGWVLGGKAGRIIRIPKPFEWAIVANAMERGVEYANGDGTAISRLMGGLALMLTPPASPPAIQLAFETATNYDMFSGRSIVPEYEKGKPPAQQYNEYTSSLARSLGAITNVSPFMLDHLMSGLGATWYRDIVRITNGVDPRKPSLDAEDLPIISRFARDVRGGSRTSADFYARAGKQTGALNQAAAGYKHEAERSPAAGEAFLNQLPAEDRAYAVLMNHFETGARRLSPHYRVAELAGVLSGMRRALQSDLGLSDTSFEEDKTAIIPLTRGEKSEVDELLSEISRREMRNLLIATNTAGWGHRKMLPLDATLDLLRVTSPAVYDEYQRRVAKAKIYDAQVVYDYWPEVQARLASDREYAILDDLVAIGESTVIP